MVIYKSASAVLLFALASLLANSVRAEAQDAALDRLINEAIDRGSAYLKAYDESPLRARKRPGAWALRGWALLESGVPAGDPAVKRIVDYIRQETPDMEETYDVALAIIFLDKLGDSSDQPLLESLGVRLLAAQSSQGGWVYMLYKPNVVERARLAKLIADSETLRAQGVIVRRRSRTPQEVAADIDRQVKAISVESTDYVGDNSNTQFAMMAMWVARRHGVPVNKCLELVEKRFQNSQVKSGVWGYNYPFPGPAEDDNQYTHPAMTCAGLLGLALGQGVQAKPRDLLKDEQVKRGLAVLSRAFDKPPNAKRPNYLYYLFSLERMAVVYNLKTIGAHDWYSKGAGDLVASQAQDGSWSAGYPEYAVDTCFALLFLKRANVARDLSEILAVPIRKGPGVKSSGMP